MRGRRGLGLEEEEEWTRRRGRGRRMVVDEKGREAGIDNKNGLGVGNWTNPLRRVVDVPAIDPMI